jgi:predicted RND superfamily exporter protein
VSYFLEVSYAFHTFESLILTGVFSFISENKTYIALYFAITGLFVILLILALLYYHIESARKEIRFLKIALSNIPLDTLMDQQTINQIRNLEKE